MTKVDGNASSLVLEHGDELETPLSMPWIAPEGKTMILCELGAQPGDDVWRLTDDEAIERCVSTLDPLIPDVRSRVIGASVLRQPLGYPVFALDYEPDRAALAAEGTGITGLYSVGRNGEFDHILMEDTFWRLRRRIPMIAQLHTSPPNCHSTTPASERCPT